MEENVPAQQEPWAIRVSGDEAMRKPGENLRKWAGDERTTVRRLIDRVTAKDDKDPKLAGALGEELVAKELDKLGEGWTVLHGVRVGKVADVDHLVIGPPGVFCLNTKRIAFDSDVVVSPRQFRVNGYSRDYYPKAVKEASRVEVRLQAAVGVSLTVRPVLVLVNLDRRRLTVKGQPDDVTVVIRKRILRWLREQPAILTPEQVGLLARKCRHPATWDPSKADQVLDRLPERTPAPRPAPVPLVPPAPLAETSEPEPLPSPPATAAAAPVVLVPWRRYGHDRLYVNCATTRQRLGWRDETTGQVHVEPGVEPHRVHAALRSVSSEDGSIR